MAYSYTRMLYGNENELTMLHASTGSQKYETKWKRQITKEYIQHNIAYIKFKILQIYSGAYKSGVGMATSGAGDEKVHYLWRNLDNNKMDWNSVFFLNYRHASAILNNINSSSPQGQPLPIPTLSPPWRASRHVLRCWETLYFWSKGIRRSKKMIKLKFRWVTFPGKEKNTVGDRNKWFQRYSLCSSF